MWYVIQVRTGTEENICCQCRRLIDAPVLERCFIPYSEQQKRIRGEWRVVKEILFPGYVFMVTDVPEILTDRLRLVNGLTKILRTGDDMTPLADAEVELLTRLGGDRQVATMSTGIIEKDHVVILQGSLAGMEGFITRIDRHKRRAWLTIDMFSRTMEIQVGLEIIKKTD